jgi:hypothetical protein
VPGTAIGDWRVVWQTEFRPYQALLLQGAVAGPLLSTTLLLPLVLELGLSPGVAWILFLIPSFGVALQAILPTLLRLVGGRLRTLTIASFAISETRGFWFALVLLGHQGGAIDTHGALAWLAAIMVVTGIVGSVTSNNLSVWYGLVLPDADRRRLLPRVGAVSAGLSTVVLWVLTALLGTASHVGDDAYIAAFLLGGMASLAGLSGLLGLPDPGRVRVRPQDAGSTAVDARRISDDGRFRNFCISSTISAVGGGFMPAVALIALGPLGLPVGFTVLLAALASTLTLVGSGAAATLIAGLSASRVFRGTQVARLVETALILVAVVVPPAAPLLLVAATMMSALTSAVNGIAGSELLYRVSGDAILANQGRYSALTHGAFSVTSLAASAVIAASATAPVFVVLLGASGALRLIGAAVLTVSPTWRDRAEVVPTGPVGAAPA